MTTKVSPSFIALALVVTLVIAVLYVMHVMRSQPADVPLRRAPNAREIELNRLRILGPERAAKIDTRSKSTLRGRRSTEPGAEDREEPRPDARAESPAGQAD